MDYKELSEQLKQHLKDSSENGTSLELAERLAAKFLYAETITAEELSKKSLDARMKKSGNKAIRSAVYLNIVSSSEKKPTEAQISAMLETDEDVGKQQTLLDEAEVQLAELQNYYDIFNNGHIYYRGVAKGSNFNG